MATLDVRLRQRIADAAEPSEAARWQAELAAYLARMGRFEQGRATLAAIDAQARWASPALACRVFLAQGLIALADEFGPEAADRLRRAHAVAQLCGLAGPAATVAAWLGHYAFNQGHYEEMAQWHQACVAGGPDVEPAARNRLLLTAANAWRHAGDFELSDRLYASAHALAVREGDEAFIAAGLYNRAACGIARLRLEAVDAPAPSAARLQQAGLEIDSAIHYAQGTGHEASTALQALWRARLAMLQGRHAEALPVLRHSLEHLAEARHEHLRLSLRVDCLACEAALGQAPATPAPDPLDAAILEPDDRVVCLWQLERLSDQAGAGGAPVRELRQRAQAAHQAEIQRVSRQLRLLEIPEDWLVRAR